MSRENHTMTARWRRERARAGDWKLIELLGGTPSGSDLATVWQREDGAGWEAEVDEWALAGRPAPDGPWETAREARAAVERALPHWRTKK